MSFFWLDVFLNICFENVDFCLYLVFLQAIDSIILNRIYFQKQPLRDLLEKYLFFKVTRKQLQWNAHNGYMTNKYMIH